MSQWANSDRRSRLPADWAKIRSRVFRRDGYRCTARMLDRTRCPEPATDCDHKIPGDDHSMENLTSLCSWHHGKKSGNEGGKARAAKWRSNNRKFRRGEAHPGLALRG